MVDREARDKLTEIINQYLNDRITSFKFSEQTCDIKTNDAAILQFVSLLWLFYDDLKNHKVVLDKDGWDFFQRILLFLKTDMEIKTDSKPKRVFSFLQIIALLALCIQVYYLINIELILPVLILGGLVAYPILKFRNLIEDKLMTENDRRTIELIENRLYPFKSFSEIRQAKQITNFKKSIYPQHFNNRTIRSKFTNKFFASNFYLFTLLCLGSPLVLLYACFPIYKPKIGLY